MKHYESLPLLERMSKTPKAQRNTIYKFIEKHIKKDKLTTSEMADLSRMLGDLVKIHNHITYIENGRLVSALIKKNINLEGLETGLSMKMK